MMTSAASRSTRDAQAIAFDPVRDSLQHGKSRACRDHGVNQAVPAATLAEFMPREAKPQVEYAQPEPARRSISRWSSS